MTCANQWGRVFSACEVRAVTIDLRTLFFAEVRGLALRRCLVTGSVEVGGKSCDVTTPPRDPPTYSGVLPGLL